MSDAELISQLAAARLLPVGDAPWSEHQRWLVEAGQRLINLGLATSGVVRLARLGWDLAQAEVDAVVAEVGGGMQPEAALERQGQRRQAVTRFIAAVRHGSVSATMQRLMGISGEFHRYSSELLHVPSALFMTLCGLPDVLIDWREQSQTDGHKAVLLARLLIGMGRYDEAARHLETAEASAEALAHLAIAYNFLGRPEDAESASKRALAIDGSNPIAQVLGAVVCAFAAGRATQIHDATHQVSEALDLLARSREVAEPADPWQRLEVLLARGRISILMPPDFGIHQAGADDLQRVLQAAASLDAKDVPRGVPEIFELHACYFLGQALAQEIAGDADAQQGQRRRAVELLQRVVVIDPACSFAERAYLRISELEHA